MSNRLALWTKVVQGQVVVRAQPRSWTSNQVVHRPVVARIQPKYPAVASTGSVNASASARTIRRPVARAASTNMTTSPAARNRPLIRTIAAPAAISPASHHRSRLPASQAASANARNTPSE